MNATVLSAPAKKPKTIFDLLDAPDTKKKMGHVLSGHITPEKMLRLSINAVRKTPRLLECNPYSVFGAIMTSAALDLEPNTVLGQAYLIPYGKSVPQKDENGNVMLDSKGKWLWTKQYECNFQIGYRGFIELAYRAPRLIKIEAEAIHANDKFENQQGSDSFLKYTKKLENRGDLVGAFCYMKAHTDNGSTADVVGILPLDEIYKIRARSETYKSLTKAVEAATTEKERAKAEVALAETPWVMWEDDMVAKSAIKKAIKKFPLSGKINTAAQIDNSSEGGTLDLEAMSDADLAKSVAEGDETPATIEYQPEVSMPLVQPVQDKGEKITVNTEVAAQNKAAAQSSAPNFNFQE